MYVPENHNHSDPKPLDFGASSSRKFGFSTSSVNFFFFILMDLIIWSFV
jgi:hypothetical protein